MAYKKTYTIDGDILNCAVSGERTAAESREVTLEMFSVLKAHKIKLLLLELDLTGRMHIEDILKNTQKVIHQIKQYKLTIAIVDYNKQSFHDNFLASVYASEEDATIKVFETKETASLGLKSRFVNEKSDFNRK